MHEAAGGWELIVKGGFMMYPLLGAAILALAVILERLHAFHLRYRTPGPLVERALAMARSGDSAGAERECGTALAPQAAVLAAGLRHFSHSREQMELAMKNEAERWVPRLERRIGLIDTVITAAPLMGLLGTITGMMSSFQVLSTKGVNEPNAITGGVAEALIATATGLVVALFCLLAYNHLATRVKRIVYDLESVASQLLEARLAREDERKRA